MFKDIVNNFKKHNIKVVAAKNRGEATDIILAMIPSGASVSYGGSVSLEQIGILGKLRAGDYRLNEIKWDNPDRGQVLRQAFTADYFLSSSNAVTRDGQIVNKDGNGNRVAAMIYGPKKVVIVVGKNKVVNDEAEAMERIRNIAGPLNAKRLNKNTPCVKTGKCMDCNSPQTICRVTAVINSQSDPDRMTIVMVDEELGY